MRKAMFYHAMRIGLVVLLISGVIVFTKLADQHIGL
jgi:hypothetical protein